MATTDDTTGDAAELEAFGGRAPGEVGTLAARLRRGTGRAAAVAAGAVLALGACGDDPAGADAPSNAAVGSFCEVMGGIEVDDPERLVEDMSKTGTPKGIPADARSGFEVMIDNSEAEEISDSDQDKVGAFLAYVSTTCAAS